MKKKTTILISVLLVLSLGIGILCWLGVGGTASNSAVQDLKAELESIYGPEYAGKEVENGTEDMVFEVEPKTWFLTNWNLRNTLGLDYRYECKAIFTSYVDGNADTVRTVTYCGVDPMGEEKMGERAYLDLDSKTERTENQ